MVVAAVVDAIVVTRIKVDEEPDVAVSKVVEWQLWQQYRRNKRVQMTTWMLMLNPLRTVVTTIVAVKLVIILEVIVIIIDY
jgi:hypothetical protein